MPSIIFVGANSDIANATLTLLEPNKNVVLLTRDVNKLPNEVRQQYECHSCNPCEQEDLNKSFENKMLPKQLTGEKTKLA